ncbi:MAG: elongation factor G, partial [Dehalococcoidia bacterium]
MRDYGTEHIRNVVLLSHCGAGKTSLSEAMLYTSGAINRLGKVDEGTTTSDHEADEVKRQISINLSLLPCEWKDTKINLIDTPGYADFVGEVRAGIRGSDEAIIVVCAVSGVEVGTEQVWQYAAEANLPRFIVVNKMDRENADFQRRVEEIRSCFGTGCVPIQLPLGAAEGFQGVIDLLRMKAHSGPKLEEGEIPDSLQGQADSYREKLVEAVVEIDDDLIAKYLEGEEISQAEVSNALKKAVMSGKVTPILVGSALQNIGIPLLLNAICDYLPSPKEKGQVVATNPAAGAQEELEPDQAQPPLALVFKTSADPYVGKLTCFRVYSGSIHSNSQVWNATKKAAERIGQLFMLRGKAQEPASQLIAGDIGAVAKLTTTGTGDTLCQRDHPLLLAPIQFPLPSFSVAVYPKTKADLDKLGTALLRLSEEDLTLVVHKEPDTGETTLSGLGESHVEVAAEKMLRKFGVAVELSIPKVPYKETVTVSAKAEYKHKKQTGGHGQYGHVFLELEPLPRGTGFEFAGRVVGGSVPKNYISAVEKGVHEASQEGVLAGYSVVDVRATLYDGSSHPVDSSDIAFKIAGAQALKKGLAQAQPVLLEPIMNITITVPRDFTGDTIGDLNTKRAKVLGMNPEDGTNVIEAQAPLAESLRYATDLRSITQGRGSFTMQFSHYEEVP